MIKSSVRTDQRKSTHEMFEREWQPLLNTISGCHLEDKSYSFLFTPADVALEESKVFGKLNPSVLTHGRSSTFLAVCKLFVHLMKIGHYFVVRWIVFCTKLDLIPHRWWIDSAVSRQCILGSYELIWSHKLNISRFWVGNINRSVECNRIDVRITPYSKCLRDVSTILFFTEQNIRTVSCGLGPVRL